MGKYITNKDDMKFQNENALKTVLVVIEEAGAAVNDKSRKITDSQISEVLSGALGVGAGSAIGFAALYLGGSVVGLLSLIHI